MYANALSTDDAYSPGNANLMRVLLLSFLLFAE